MKLINYQLYLNIYLVEKEGKGGGAAEYPQNIFWNKDVWRGFKLRHVKYKKLHDCFVLTYFCLFFFILLELSCLVQQIASLWWDLWKCTISSYIYLDSKLAKFG